MKAVFVVLSRDALTLAGKSTLATEMPLSGHVVHFDPYAVRVFEEH